MYPVRGFIHPRFGGLRCRSTAPAKLEFDDGEKGETKWLANLKSV
jgi:hypothetical protein